MAAIVTRDTRHARSLVRSHHDYAVWKRLAHREARRTEKQRLAAQGADYVPAGKPRLTGWEIA